MFVCLFVYVCVDLTETRRGWPEDERMSDSAQMNGESPHLHQQTLLPTLTLTSSPGHDVKLHPGRWSSAV